MEQRTLKIGDRIIYCYADGSVEFLSTAKQHRKNPLVRTFGSKNYKGYRYIRITLNGELQSLRVHRLIAMAFCPNPDNLSEVDHINRDRTDNRPCNLRWVSAKTNKDNQTRVDISLAKYGTRRCDDYSGYRKAYNKLHYSLQAKKPSGTCTRYYFESPEDPIYRLLKPLSLKERYFKYQELKGARRSYEHT